MRFCLWAKMRTAMIIYKTMIKLLIFSFCCSLWLVYSTKLLVKQVTLCPQNRVKPTWASAQSYLALYCWLLFLISLTFTVDSFKFKADLDHFIVGVLKVCQFINCSHTVTYHHYYIPFYMYQWANLLLHFTGLSSAVNFELLYPKTILLFLAKGLYYNIPLHLYLHK